MRIAAIAPAGYATALGNREAGTEGHDDGWETPAMVLGKPYRPLGITAGVEQQLRAERRAPWASHSPAQVAFRVPQSGS